MATANLTDLRAELAGRGLDGFLVPRADEHLGEYVPPAAERLAWLTGFTGSAGLAVVLAQRAALFVDGRYVLQAAAQADATLWERRHITEEPPPAWIAAAAPGARIGYDPWLIAEEALRRFLDAGADHGGDRAQPDRHGLARPARAAAAPGRAAPAALCRAQQCGEAGRDRRRAAGGAAGCGGHHRSRLARLAAQHPRQRRAVHAVRARLRAGACGRPRGAVHGRPEAAARRRGPGSATASASPSAPRCPRRSRRWRASGCGSIRPAPRPGSPSGCARRGRRWRPASIPACSRKPARTRSSRRARARPTGATRARWCRSCTGWRRRPGRSPRPMRRPSCSSCAPGVA